VAKGFKFEIIEKIEDLTNQLNMTFKLSSFAILSSIVVFAAGDDDFAVNCGSAIKLKHVQNPNYYLDSAGFNWSTGSGQQVVTLKKSKGESSSMWQVQEAYNQTCETGKPIKCGDRIRLMHLDTKKRLHTHPLKSVLSGGASQEVSGFGDTGEYGVEGGDASDDWDVICSDHYWMQGQNVRLCHVGTGAYLRSSTDYKFTNANCPRCPIVGDLEVAASQRANHLTLFQADKSGVHVSK